MTSQPLSEEGPLTIALFYHSLVSDWNHGNAHFLRGIVSELGLRGHRVRTFEPRMGWSLTNLIEEEGREAVHAFHRAYPGLVSTHYELESFDADKALDGVDLVLAHEWNDPELLRLLGKHRSRNPNVRLLFHDTHHRAVTNPERMEALDLRHFDGVLAYGEVLKDIYLRKGWSERAWTWHEAADVRVFRPVEAGGADGGRWTDLVWIGNWGDDERTRELEEFLIEPVHDLGIRARVHGVRYPPEARGALANAGIEFCGRLANFDVPRAYSRARVTVHIPRRPYVRALPGIPTIRPFEALACGIPLVTSLWEDVEGLFRPGTDFLVARDGREMKARLLDVLNDTRLAGELSRNGRRTIMERHTCAHRVDELLEIADEIGVGVRPAGSRRRSAASGAFDGGVDPSPRWVEASRLGPAGENSRAPAGEGEAAHREGPSSVWGEL